MAALYAEPKTSSCCTPSAQVGWWDSMSTYHFAGDVHAIEFLLVVCTRLCAVVGHEDQLLPCDSYSAWLSPPVATSVC
jgi:hypothetical protein